jgi:hypothetical protein
MLTLTCYSALAQERLSPVFSNQRFTEFVTWAEDHSAYRFYYRPSEMDSLVVNIQADHLSMDSILQLICSQTPYHFFIDEMQHVYMTRKVTINASLPVGYFEKDSGRVANIIQSSNPGQLTAKKKLIGSSEENKLYEIGVRTGGRQKEKAVLSGYVLDARNGEAIAGATLYVDSLSVGVVTDRYGYYSITIPGGRHILNISSVGMKSTYRQLLVNADGTLNLELVEYIPSLKEVVITTERRSNIRGLQMGVDKLTIKTIKQVPVVFGEADLLKVVLTLPGVTSVGEGSSGYNVRGGSTDQNLILFNDQTIYNPTHLFGFFTSFNPDVIKGAELYKSFIPEKYGGRLSSVLDVSSKEGNTKNISGTGGIGLLTSKLMLEGPIVKNKLSFLVSGRSTYSDWLLRAIPNSAYNNSEASFSDIDVHLTWLASQKSRFYFNAYWSKDRFRLNSDTLYRYGNLNMNLKWKYVVNSKLYGVFTVGSDAYQYEVSSDAIPRNAYRLSFGVNQANFRSDFSYSPNNKHLIDFGINSIYYRLNPGSFQPHGAESLVTTDKIPQEQALESAVYAGDQYTLSSRLSVNTGFRFSFFQYLGPHEQLAYQEGVPREKNTVTDTLSYGSGKTVKTYGGPEVRFSVRYSLNSYSSLKLSFNTLRQYIHMLTNTTAISPTDVWKLSDGYIKPQIGEQLALGFYHNYRSNTIEASLEVYFKRFRNYLDYKSGAQLILNHHIETDVINTEGHAYGAELMIKKASGKLNGWINYSYSRAMLKTDDPISGELVNGGRYYPTNYDKPHNVNLISNYQFSHRYSLSFNFVYSTGRPITLPIAIFDFNGSQRVYYSDRNQYRIPDYIRGDISFNMDGNHKIKQRIHNSWSFGVYNFFARKNVYSIYFVQENGKVKGYQLSIFATAIPFVSFNFRF